MRETLRDFVKRLSRKPLSLAGLGLITMFSLVALSAPLIAPPEEHARDPYLIPQDGYSPDPLRPNAEHIFGTTEQQYDLYYGIVWFELQSALQVTNRGIGHGAARRSFRVCVIKNGGI